MSTLLTKTIAFLMVDPVPPSPSTCRKGAQKAAQSSSQQLPARSSTAPGCLAGTTSIPVSSGWQSQSSLCPPRTAPAPEPPSRVTCCMHTVSPECPGTVSPWAQQHRTRGCAHLLDFTELSESSEHSAAEQALMEITKGYSWWGTRC